jgi:predicted nucleic acid-binding protein
MKFLVGTNIVGRMAEPGRAQSQLAADASIALDARGDSLYLVPQVLCEFWVVATRPTSSNGLGLSVQHATSELVRLKGLFPLLFDTPSIYPEWERLVTTHGVIGKSAHDARLAAAMVVHGLTHILSFNAADFARYPGITAVDPATVLAPGP